MANLTATTKRKVKTKFKSPLSNRGAFWAVSVLSLRFIFVLSKGAARVDLCAHSAVPKVSVFREHTQVSNQLESYEEMEVVQAEYLDKSSFLIVCVCINKR